MRRILHRHEKGIAFLLVFIMVFSAILQFGPVRADAESSLTITKSAGWLESAYCEWTPVKDATGYKAYVKGSGSGDWVLLDNELIRQYADHWRADALGLKAGSCEMKIEALMSDGSSVTAETGALTVLAHDRSGFAFSSNSTHKTASGAYNDDGTLKSGAQVIYVTPQTAKTCTATVNGKVVTGFQSILDAKQKKNNTDILDFRIIGCVKFADLDHITSSEEGIQVKGASAYQNMNITIEGVGEDAAVHGFGFLIRNCGNVELRNFAIMNFMDDGVSIDTSNCNLWIHNLDLFYGGAGGDADQKKGDGSIDIKKSQYCTVSYNHFWDSGKCCLIDASASTSGYADYLTYHHNWFDHSDSRHPRIRNGKNFHIYNNYYDGNSKYGVGATTGSSAFVEANYFEGCKFPMMIAKQGTDALGEGTFSKDDGGMIKAYNNHVEGASSYIPYSDSASTEFDAYEVSSRSQEVPSNVTTKAGSAYSNFDTAASMYTYTADSPETAKQKVVAYAGRMNGGDLKWSFDTSEDANYEIIEGLKTAVEDYTSPVVSIGGDSIGSTEKPSEGPSEKPSEEESSSGSTEKPSEEESSSGSGSQTPSGGNHIHNFTTNGKESNYFTIKGNLSTKKGTVTYNGLTLTQCLKMEGSDVTSITFTTSADAKLVLVFAETGKKVNVDGTKKTCSGNVLEMELTKGEHKIIKTDSINLFYMAVLEPATEQPTTEQPTTEPVTEPTTEPVTEPGTEPATEPTTKPTEQPTDPGLKDFELNMSDLEKATYTENFSKNGFTILADAAGTVVVDGSSKTYQNVKYTNRLKTGGEGTADSRSIRFTTQDAATVTMIVVSASGSASRVMGISDGTKDDNGKLVDFATATVGTTLNSCKFTVPAAGTYYIHSTSGGLNFYHIKVSYAVSGGNTPGRTDDELREQAPDFKAGDLYVSTKGTQTASGSFEDPMDLVTALGKIGAGNTIWMFSGTYYTYDMYQKPILIDANNCGTENAYKTVSSINGKRVTIDFDGMQEDGSNRGITLDGDYWHFYDIDICNAGDNGMLLSGNHNIIELCKFYGNHDTGLQLSRYDTSAATVDLWPSHNLILNCTAYNNKDEATAENADGFAAKLTCGEGNIFDGCISYCNSDDGWDLYAKPATGSIGVVTIRNCVAFGNGKLTDGTGSANGDMNGFKLGGSNGACPTPHVVENCLAFYNGATGFTDNGNGGAITMKNCTAVANGVYESTKANFMCYRTSADAQYANLLSYASSKNASTDQFLGVLNHVLYQYKGQGYYWVNNWTCTDGAKTKYSGSEAKDQTVAAADFVNMTIPGYNASTGAYTADYHTIFRNADGSINMDGLFELKSESKLYTAGVDGKYIGSRFLVNESDLTYTVSVTNGTASTVKAKEGEEVTITADTITGKVFSKWSVKSGNVSLAEEGSAATTFIMPAAFVEIEAVYTDAPVEQPSETPTEKPSEAPTEKPSETPTEKPIETPTEKPSADVPETPYKIELGEFSDDILTEEMKQTIGCETAEELKSYLKVAITESVGATGMLEGISTENTHVLDVQVLISLDGGETWVPATKENFPKTGADVILPYPEGVSRENTEFIVGHMITIGYDNVVPGTIEYFVPEQTDDGLKIHVNSASPFVIGWKYVETKEDVPPVSDDKDSDDTQENPTATAATEASKAPETTPAQQETTVQAESEAPKTKDVMGGSMNILFMMFMAAGIAGAVSMYDKKRVK